MADINQTKLNIQEQINKLVGDERDDYQRIFDLLVRNNGSLSEFQLILINIRRAVRELNGDLSYTNRLFEELTDKLKTQPKLLQLQETIVSKINGILRDILDIRKGETYADESHVKSLQRQIDLELERLKNLALVGARSGQLSNDEIAKLDEQIQLLEENRKELDDILDRHREIKAEMRGQHSASLMLDGIFKKMGLPDLGFGEVYKETVKAAQGAKAAGVPFNALGHYSKLIGDNFGKAFNKISLLTAGVGYLLEALVKGDTATGQLAKDFNLTYNEAVNLREELTKMSLSSVNTALNTRSLQESMVAVGKSLGSNAKLNEEDLKTFTELREMAGYTNEELIGMQKMSLAMDKPLKDNVKSFLGTTAALNAQNKLTINEKQLLKEVANTSVAIRLSIGGTAEDLAKAAFRAKQFGINLEQADRIAESLLDFESSISNELAAELLTGRDLNLERARLLALNGQISEASAEILRQVKGSAEFTAMNRIQQEAIAKAVGMSREDLAKSLIEREALNKLGLKEAATAKAKFDLLVKEKGYAEAVKEMGDDEYARQLKQQSIQERFNQSVEKLQEIFVTMSEPILRFISPIVDTLMPVITIISNVFSGIFYYASLIGKTLGGWTGLAIGLIPVLLRASTIIRMIRMHSMAGAIASIYGSFAKIPYGLGIPLAIAAISGLGALMASAVSAVSGTSETKFAKGGIVTGEINNATIGEAGPEAIIPLNSPKADKFLGKESITDNNAIIQELKNLRQDINNLNNRPIHVGIDVDGQKLAAAVAQYPTTFNTNFNRKAVKA